MAFRIRSQEQVLDLTSPTKAVPVGYHDSTGYTYAAALIGPYVCVADGAAGLEVLNASNPANLVAAGSRNTGGFAEKVFLSGNYVCLAVKLGVVKDRGG